MLNRAQLVWKVPLTPINWRNHKLKEPRERIREASPSEEAALFDTVRPDYAPILAFALLAGRRLSEIVNLTWARVDLINRTYTTTGKGDKRTTFPLSDIAFQLLWSLKDDHPTHVFTYICQHPGNKRGTPEAPRKIKGNRYPITESGLKTNFRRLKKTTNIDDFRFHDLRHTFATRLLRATNNIRLVQMALDHEDIATTARYSHVNSDDLRAGLNAVPVPNSTTESPTQSNVDHLTGRNK